MRVLTLAAVFGVMLTGGLTAAPVPKDKAKEKTTEEKLTGKWKLVKSDMALPDDYDFVIDYQAKGKMQFIRTPKEKDAKPVVSDGKYKVNNEKMEIEWTVNEFGNERGETSKIKKLTDDKLIIEDPEGVKEEFDRVVEKKKEPKKD